MIYRRMVQGLAYWFPSPKIPVQLGMRLETLQWALVVIG